MYNQRGLNIKIVGEIFEKIDNFVNTPYYQGC